MSGLVDGADLPWDIVSSRHEKPGGTIPARVTRTPPAPGSTIDTIRRLGNESTPVRDALGAVACMALHQLESRRRWYRTITESLKEHR
jgi:hypothetical protein